MEDVETAPRKIAAAFHERDRRIRTGGFYIIHSRFGRDRLAESDRDFLGGAKEANLAAVFEKVVIACVDRFLRNKAMRRGIQPKCDERQQAQARRRDRTMPASVGAAFPKSKLRKAAYS